MGGAEARAGAAVRRAAGAVGAGEGHAGAGAGEELARPQEGGGRVRVRLGGLRAQLRRRAVEGGGGCAVEGRGAGDRCLQARPRRVLGPVIHSFGLCDRPVYVVR